MGKPLFILLILFFIGCSKQTSNENTPSADKQLSQEDYAKDCLRKLQKKNDGCNQDWGLGSFEQWIVDQENGHLIFSGKNGIEVTCSFQFIGSISSKSGTWLWAWDNPTISDPLKKYAQKTLTFGKERKFKKLTTANWPASEEDAWEMTAIACEIGNAIGAYRGLFEGGAVFMAIDQVVTKTELD